MRAPARVIVVSSLSSAQIEVGATSKEGTEGPVRGVELGKSTQKLNRKAIIPPALPQSENSEINYVARDTRERVSREHAGCSNKILSLLESSVTKLISKFSLWGSADESVVFLFNFSVDFPQWSEWVSFFLLGSHLVASTILYFWCQDSISLCVSNASGECTEVWEGMSSFLSATVRKKWAIAPMGNLTNYWYLATSYKDNYYSYVEFERPIRLIDPEQGISRLSAHMTCDWLLRA